MIRLIRYCVVVAMLSALACNQSQPKVDQGTVAPSAVAVEVDAQEVQDGNRDQKGEKPPLAAVKAEPENPVQTDPGKTQTKIVQEKTQTWAGSKENYVKYSDLAFQVGMGAKKDGVGIAEVGLEIENIKKLKITLESFSTFRRFDDNSYAGFMIDYHTGSGYTKRVALAMGFYSPKKWSRNPLWGKVTPPDQFVDLGKQKDYELDLQKWAPEGWDHKVWFTISLQNSGMNTKLQGSIAIVADPFPLLAVPSPADQEKAEREKRQALAKAEQEKQAALAAKERADRESKPLVAAKEEGWERVGAVPPKWVFPFRNFHPGTISEDGKLLTITDEDTQNGIAIHSTTTGECIDLVKLHTPFHPRGPVFNPDGSLAFLSGDRSGRKVIVYDPLKKQIVKELRGLDFAFSRDGKTLFCGGDELSLYDIPSWAKRTLPVKGVVSEPEAGGLLAIYQQRSSNLTPPPPITIWNTAEGKKQAVIQLKALPTLDPNGAEWKSASFSRSGRYLMTQTQRFGGSDCLLLWDTREGAPVEGFNATINHVSAGALLAGEARLIGDDKLLAWHNRQNGSALVVWDIPTAKALRTVEFPQGGIYTQRAGRPGKAYPVAYSPDGSEVAVSLDRKNGAILAICRVQDGQVAILHQQLFGDFSARFTASGNEFILVTSDGVVTWKRSSQPGIARYDSPTAITAIVEREANETLALAEATKHVQGRWQIRAFLGEPDLIGLRHYNELKGKSKYVLTVAGGDMSITTEAGGTKVSTVQGAGITFDDKKQPATIDIASPDRRYSWQGIYELQGDTLTLAIAREGKDRPKKLTPTPDVMVLRLEREVKEIPLPTVKELEAKADFDGVKQMLGVPTEIVRNQMEKNTNAFLYIWDKSENGFVAIYFLDNGKFLIRGGIVGYRVDRQEVERLKRIMAGRLP